MVCDIASGFWQEHANANPDAELESSDLLRRLHRKRKTKHENTTSKILKDMGLSCPMPMDQIEVDGDLYPCFRVESYLRIFSLHNKLSLLLGHVNDFSLVEEYWTRYKAIDPNHPTFSYHGGREKFVIPCYIHCDEGRTLKKSSIMVCNLQPVLGSNPDPDYDSSELHTNMKLATWATRLLLFVMLKQAYKKNDRPLYAAWESVAAELARLFEEGCTLVVRNVRITIYVCVVAAKGDWPLLAKIGRLARFFGRKSSAANAQGICHLCCAGRASYPYHDYTETATWRATYLQHEPYKPRFVPPFSVLPQHSALWYRYDIFHTCHKGIFAELAGSAIVALLHLIG